MRLSSQEHLDVVVAGTNPADKRLYNTTRDGIRRIRFRIQLIESPAAFLGPGGFLNYVAFGAVATMRTSLALSLFATTALAIWPLPVSYTNGSETLWIDQNVKISYNGGNSVSYRVRQITGILLIRLFSRPTTHGPARSSTMRSNGHTIRC